MANYAMHKRNKEATVFSTTSTLYSDEYADASLSLFLRDQFVEDEKHRIHRQYRLHARQPHTIDMALAYDIDCPHCGHRLKQIGRCLNSHDLGLYTCPACDSYYGRRK